MKMKSLSYVARIGVALVFTACGGGGYSSPGALNQGTTAGNAVSISNFSFQPQTITVAAGVTVTWTNADSIAHTSTSDATGWNSNNINPGQTFSLQFNTAGTFTYHCNIHPGMTGTVVVQ